jgi:hypothetical protein
MSIRKYGRAWLLLAALGALGCGDDEPGSGIDSGSVADGGSSDGSVRDGSITDGSVTDGASNDGRVASDGSAGDSGPSACAAAASAAASTVGCNGGFAATPAMNAPGGQCTPGGESRPAGTCTTDGAICSGALAGGDLGWCTVVCTAPTTHVDAQNCPTGFRCFRMGSGTDAFGMCFRDCDATHPCQEGWACDAQGRCQEETPT